jgi:hypothetical protein
MTSALPSFNDISIEEAGLDLTFYTFIREMLDRNLGLYTDNPD